MRAVSFFEIVILENYAKLTIESSSFAQLIPIISPIITDFIFFTLILR